MVMEKGNNLQLQFCFALCVVNPVAFSCSIPFLFCHVCTDNDNVFFGT